MVYGENKKRIVGVKFDEYGEAVITIDLHGLRLKEAKKLIDAVITIIPVSFTLDLIHGYNHGTALKEYIHNQLDHERIIDRYCNSYNAGETFLQIA